MNPTRFPELPKPSRTLGKCQRNIIQNPNMWKNDMTNPLFSWRSLYRALLEEILIWQILEKPYSEWILQDVWHLGGLDFHCFWHNLHILSLPRPSPKFLPGFYPYSRRDLEDLHRKTYQKPAIKRHKSLSNHINHVHSYVFLIFLAVFIPPTESP